VNDPSHTSFGADPVDGVFVMGMFGSGIHLVGDVLTHLGLTPVDVGGSRALVDFNDRLLNIAGGSTLSLPAASPREVARILAPFKDEARQIFETVVSYSVRSRGTGTPWVMTDPRFSMLASFWKDALDIRPALVLVHRDPAELVEGRTSELGPDDDAEAVYRQWDRYNRAAMVQCFEWSSAVVQYGTLLSQPKEQVSALSDFLEQCGVAGEPGGAERAVEVLESTSTRMSDSGRATAKVPAEYRVIDRILWRLNGPHVDAAEWQTMSDVLGDVTDFYDEDYYGESYDKSGVPYRRDETLWVDFFSGIAKAIVSTLDPGTVLDVGCATGILVESLRNLDVDARGIDVSAWAIAQVPEELREFYRVATVTEEIEGNYDLITCFEVVEHLPAFVAARAIANLCRHADAILFSSTPDDFDETTHLNVETAGYWANLFLDNGFLRDADYDASFVTPHAVLFRRRTVGTHELVGEYERAIANAISIFGARVEDAVKEHDRLADRYNEMAGDLEAHAGEHNDEVSALNTHLTDLGARRNAEVLAAHEAMVRFERDQQRLSLVVGLRESELEAFRQTKTFRYTARLRRVYERLRRSRSRGPRTEAPASLVDMSLSGASSYGLWVEQFDTIDDGARAAIRGRLNRLTTQPLVSVIMPVYNTPAPYLKAAIDSVRNQLYANWELCIADDCSTEPHVAEILRGYEALDARIRVVVRSENGHISAASNTALGLATGTWIAPVDHDDLLPEHALALAVLALADNEDAGLLYSDEDKIDQANRRHSPNFKPDFDPLLLLGQNLLTHLSLLRRDLVLVAGGYREGFEGAQDWDLVLRIVELLEPGQVVHVPHVLYHWRSHSSSTASALSAKPYAANAGQRSVVEHLERRGLSGEVSQIPLSGHNRVKWRLPEPVPRVSIIIPTKDGRYLQRCIDSVLSFTSYPDFEIVVVDNGSRQMTTLDYLRVREGQISVIRDDRPFNYSALNNAAVERVSGSVICLLNDDTEVISGDWLEEMVSQLLQPGVGAVGAKLYYPDGRIQHAGVILGIGGVAGHSHRFSDRLSPGYFGRLLLAQTLSAVTGACMVVRRQAWDEVGGLDEEHLAVAFNDVDFGIRLCQAGWRIVWTPQAELFHHESVSRGPDSVGQRLHDSPREIEYVESLWSTVLRTDPAYNPNLTLVTEDFSLAWPPRVTYR
jgi:glycosyltransferase involved in cell wall biosynthesis/2-polyprenyl-3-methyl-5-hydroxy-6-metoxy-1,4-benzoquinol methylase